MNLHELGKEILYLQNSTDPGAKAALADLDLIDAIVSKRNLRESNLALADAFYNVHVMAECLKYLDNPSAYLGIQE